MRTREQNIEIIREACIAANPEIRGGHFFEVGYNTCKFCLEPRIVRDRRVHSEIVDENTGGSVREVSETIIDTTDHPCPKHFARPVRLADVLLAINALINALDELENIKERHILHILTEPVSHWDLRNDDLTLQSDEILQFAADLLAPTQDEGGEIREGV